MKELKNVAAYPIGGAVGAGAGWLIATKLIKTSNMWYTIGIAVVGAIGGSMIAAKMSESKTATAITVKK